MAFSEVLIICLLLAGGAISAYLKKLTLPAAITGMVLGYLIYKGAGYTRLILLGTFFVAGTAATSWGLPQKQQIGLAEERGGKRTAGQVVANAGVAGIAGLLAIFFPGKEVLLQLMVAGSFSAATADTLSSELGNLYGQSFYNVLTFKKDQKGLNGVISLEGTFCGVVGGIIIASTFSISSGFHYFGWIVLAGTIGNLADSILGATVERRGWLGNNAVNFMNTLIGALIASISQWL